MGNSYAEQTEYLEIIYTLAEGVISEYKRGNLNYPINKFLKDDFDSDFDMIADYVKEKEGIEVTYESGQINIVAKEKKRMKNCTKHSLERWVERILNIATKKERDDYIRENLEKIKEHMNKTLEFADFIYKGQIGDNTTKNFYIHNDIVFVLNTTDDAIVTVFKVDFNFTPEINLQVSKGLIKEIHRLVEEKEKLDEKALLETESLRNQSVVIDSDIKILEEQLKLLKEKKKSIDESIKQVSVSSSIIDLDIKKFTNNLVNSKEYREDLKVM